MKVLTISYLKSWKLRNLPKLGSPKRTPVAWGHAGHDDHDDMIIAYPELTATVPPTLIGWFLWVGWTAASPHGLPLWMQSKNQGIYIHD